MRPNAHNAEMVNKQLAPFLRIAFPNRTSYVVLLDGETIMHTSEAKVALKANHILVWPVLARALTRPQPAGKCLGLGRGRAQEDGEEDRGRQHVQAAYPLRLQKVLCWLEARPQDVEAHTWMPQKAGGANGQGSEHVQDVCCSPNSQNSCRPLRELKRVIGLKNTVSAFPALRH